MRTRRAFKAMLVWDATANKVNFEFAPSKFPPRKTAAAPLTKAAASRTIVTGEAATSTTARKTLKTPAKKAAKTTPAKAPRKTAATSGGSTPSAALAAVIGAEPVARAQVIKKLWDYIKDHKLQDSTNKRNINADAKLLAVFGKPQVSMFELAGIVGKHLG
jgi:DNA topoisomerase-3